MGCGQSTNQSNKQQQSLKQKNTNSQKNFTHEAKIVLLGNTGVGKSSLIERYVRNKFYENEQLPTIGANYVQQKITLKDQDIINLHIWDTAGQERFRSITSMFYRDAEAVLLIYDITQAESYDEIQNYWLKELNEKVKENSLLAIALVGNKCDLEDEYRRVQKQTAQEFANKNDMILCETSAKTAEGVHELFQQLAEVINDKKKQRKLKQQM